MCLDLQKPFNNIHELHASYLGCINQNLVLNLQLDSHYISGICGKWNIIGRGFSEYSQFLMLIMNVHHICSVQKINVARVNPGLSPQLGCYLWLAFGQTQIKKLRYQNYTIESPHRFHIRGFKEVQCLLQKEG
jgi:hypothetical protein